MTCDRGAGIIPHMENSTLLERIEQRLGELGMSPNQACERARIDRGTIRDLRRGKRTSLTLTTMSKLAAALEVSASWLAGGDGAEPPSSARRQQGTAYSAPVDIPDVASLPLDVPVLGTAAGSAVGSFVIDGAIDWVRRPPAVRHMRNVYALYVTGESMSPMFSPGALIFVSPDRPAGSGDAIVIQTRLHDGAPIQSWIKILVRQHHGDVVARQINPEAEITYKSAHVVAIHRVLTTRELFGV